MTEITPIVPHPPVVMVPKVERERDRKKDARQQGQKPKPSDSDGNDDQHVQHIDEIV